MSRARRLPGIQVDVAPPPPVEALPRMDVAVFVGFAATGPLHRPVAVESPSQFAAVFGGDAPLAWDARRGTRLFAYLGPSVRAFFANGGHRCWVIRVAHSAASVALRPRDADAVHAAAANRFPVPGMLALADEVSPASDALSPAMLAARCEGAWSDGHALSSALQRRGFAIEDWSATDSPGGVRRSFTCRQWLAAGDLLMIGDDAARCAYLRVDRVSTAGTAAAPYTVEARVLAAFERERIPVSPPSIAGDALVTGCVDAVSARIERSDETGDALWLHFDGAVPSSVQVGQWIRFDDGSGLRWLRVDAVELQARADGGSPDAGAEARVVAAIGPAWRVLESPPSSAFDAAFDTVATAQLLSCELRCIAENPGAQRLRDRLRDLALTPLRVGNPWELQRDDDYHRERNDASVLAPEDLLRFPLAPEPGAAPVAWLPLGVGAVFGAAQKPLPQAATALERDGLVPFDSTLFLDPELRGDSVDGLLGHAEDIRILRAQPRDLIGLHAVLGIGAGGLFGETSLMAVPDAMHPGWHRREDAPVDDVDPPQPRAPAHWAAHRGACLPRDGGTTVAPDFGVFLDCGTRRIDAPSLSGPQQPLQPGAFRLEWSDVGAGSVYTLYEATQSDFSDERAVYSGADRDHVALVPREGVYRYRVVAHQGSERSAASDPVVVVVRAEEWVEALPDDGGHEAEWLAIHRAMLRMSAACGDLFVVLSMPRHFETAQALRYVQRLRALRVPPLAGDADAFGFNEARATSYGAIYLPWLQSAARGGDARSAHDPAIGADGATMVRALPPDGFTVGVLAARATDRGAWIAAANAPLRDVVALATRVPASDRQVLQDAQINLLRDDPRGFLALSADTLAHEDALLPVNVRRLLILLRRLALRRGTGYVFEPNGPMLRRAIQRGFDLLLGELYARGAFAGATPAQAFRVVTDEGINTPAGVEAGRLFVELRVAPSLPMRFIAVRLAQSGERLSVSEEL